MDDMGRFRCGDHAVDGPFADRRWIVDADAHRHAGLIVARQRTARSERPGNSTALADLDIATGVDRQLSGQSPHRAPPAVQLGDVGDERTAAVERPTLVDDDTDPTGEPLEEVLGSEPRIDVRIEAVERREHRREYVVEATGELTCELVVLIDP